MDHLSRAARIILVGAPGVGKGTQTNRLLKRFPQLSSISSGDLLRQNVRDRTPLGIMLLLKIALLLANMKGQEFKRSRKLVRDS